MKKLAALILFALISLNLISQRSDKDPEAFKAAYKTFLQNVTCTASNLDTLEAFFPFDTAFVRPGYGMNGKMDYSDQDTLTVDLIRKQAINYNEPLLRNAIKAVGPEYLRFPGGTIASGYQIYPKKSSFDNDTVIHSYFLENEDAVLEVPTSGSSFIYDEGASFKNGRYFEPNPQLIASYMASTDSLVDFTSTRKKVGSQYEFNLDNDTVGSVIIPHLGDLEYILLGDFIDFIETEGIKPIYVLRIFDPLYFIELNTTGGNNLQVSPILLEELGFGYSADDNDNWFTLARMNSIRDLIKERARADMRRQMVKYVYEYI